MLGRSMFASILDNESLVRGLSDPEARVLIEWLVERTEELAELKEEHLLQRDVEVLCQRGRAISRFVQLWCHQDSWGAAAQLAATERFTWPLPSDQVDPCALMQNILKWEEQLLCGSEHYLISKSDKVE